MVKRRIPFSKYFGKTWKSVSLYVNDNWKKKVKVCSLDIQNLWKIFS